MFGNFFNKFTLREIEEYKEMFNLFKNKDRDSFPTEVLIMEFRN